MNSKEQEIGTRLIEFRKKLGYSQKEVAEKSGISRSFIAHVEVGKQTPSYDYLYRLVKTFNLSIDWVINGVGQMTIIDNDHILSKLQDKHIDCLEKLLKLPEKKQEHLINAFNEILKAD